MAAGKNGKRSRDPCALTCACERAGRIAARCRAGVLTPFGINGDYGQVYHGLECPFDALRVLQCNADGTRFKRGPRPISTGEVLWRARKRNYNLGNKCKACGALISNDATHCHKHAQGRGKGILRFYASGKKAKAK